MIFEKNTSDAYYNATGLIANTIYEIETHTVDKAGNINTTWVNHTAKTLAVNNPPNTPHNPYPTHHTSGQSSVHCG